MMLWNFYNSSAIVFVSGMEFQSQRAREEEGSEGQPYSLCFDFFSLFSCSNGIEKGISILNRLQPIKVAFFTLINKFSDRGRDKANSVAFLENFKSSMPILPEQSYRVWMLESASHIMEWWPHRQLSQNWKQFSTHNWKFVGSKIFYICTYLSTRTHICLYIHTYIQTYK